MVFIYILNFLCSKVTKSESGVCDQHGQTTHPVSFKGVCSARTNPRPLDYRPNTLPKNKPLCCNLSSQPQNDNNKHIAVHVHAIQTHFQKNARLSYIVQIVQIH